MLNAKRHEIKYIVSRREADHLIRRLDCLFSRDAYSSNGYKISSLYFDDLYNTALSDKIAGLSIRHKYRLRYYEDDLSKFKLEKKSKIQSMTHKVSTWLTQAEVVKILDGTIEFLLEKDDLCKEFYLRLKHEQLKPKTLVSYDRIAFVHPVGNLRITFDKNVTGSSSFVRELNDLDVVNVLDKEEVVLEVKFDGMMPDVVRSILQTSGHMQIASSKYVFARKFNYYL